MRPRALAAVLALAATSTLIPSLAQASPGTNSKERVGPAQPTQPTQPTMTRDQALSKLVEAEAQLTGDKAADALLLMLEVYFVLESTDGAEAAGVKELRSWLVKALETVGLPDEAATLRARGSYIDHSLEIMPSTWFKASGAVTTPTTMTNDQALAAVEQGLTLLQQGNVDGLALLIDAYFAIEQHQGAESEDAQVLRSFLVGLLETGGFVDEANALRQRGSVAAATQEDIEVYAATWLAIIEAGTQQGSSTSVLGGIDKSSIKSSVGGTTGTTTGPTDPADPDPYEEEPDPYKPKVIEPGSPIPSVGIDLGLGTFLPSVGTKGLIWTLGLDIHWTLFRAKFFGMQLGGGGQFGRNRDKRWLTDAYGDIGLLFDFEKVYFVPEFGGGYDGVAGGDKPIAEGLRWAPAGYYHFGGKLGVRFGERFGLYGRAVRLNRVNDVFANETRV
ncbi:MAG TPA: hypothetical protein VM869_25560, partial [Enhygromyxa sp.]|nr:hypothetical protein [Enhygromyxa sp.]